MLPTFDCRLLSEVVKQTYSTIKIFEITDYLEIVACVVSIASGDEWRLWIVEVPGIEHHCSNLVMHRLIESLPGLVSYLLTRYCTWTCNICGVNY